MKAKHIFAGFSAFALTSTAYADVTVNITGATAFRAATLLSIKSRFTDSGAAFKYAHDSSSGGTNFSGSTRSIWIGTFPGVSGTTTIRCCFTGSVEGVRALIVGGNTDPTAPTYYQPSLLDSTTETVGGTELSGQGTTGAAVISGVSDIAFSDVSKAITPFASNSLQPSSPAAGVIVFTMLTNEGSPITNVTTQQFRALLTKGFQPLRLFTGDAADTDRVFVTGRNDGSGTRSTYLAESGFGVANLVKQYIVIGSSGTAIQKLQLVPQGGVNTANSQPGTGQSASNASTVWGQDIAGNGGYNSGSTLRTDMGKTSTAMTVYDETYTDAFGAPINGYLVTWLSVNDAVTAKTNGAVFCEYNGSKLTGLAGGNSTMNASDTAKVTEGQYTAWGFENMYRANSITSGDKVTVYNGIKAEIPTNLAAAGIALGSMHVGRPNDGGTVAP